MKILALATCNDDYQYYRWIPHAVQFWQKLGFDFVVHFYADELPAELYSWRKHIVLEEPPKKMKLSSVCQISRLFLPTLHTDYDFVLITDVDLLPLSKDYFGMVKDFPRDKFIAMRQKEGEFYMGFNCASPSSWQRLTNTKPDREHINGLLISIFQNHRRFNLKEFLGIRPITVHWGLDQELLKKYLGSMSNSEKAYISGLDAVYSLQSGFTTKLAYFNSAEIQVDLNWIKDNKDKIAFYTRDDSRKIEMFDEEIKVLEEVYGL